MGIALTILGTSGCATEGRRVVGSRDGGLSFDGDVPGETCYNGLDDNGDGLIDERCSCVRGERQSCWPGRTSRRGVGMCMDGVQTCEAVGEFEAWGRCAGAVLPSQEMAGNGVDEDCDGNDGPGAACRAREIDGGGCADGTDDDCDGRVDCDDPDCAATEECAAMCTATETSCDDSFDNDCDTRVDCLDPDCGDIEPCRTIGPPPGCTPVFPFFIEISCGNGRDDDCDGDEDCADSDCLRPSSCGCSATESACSDGMDEDCDRDTDCQDVDCQACTDGSYRYCDDETDSLWGIQNCFDGRWGGCVTTSSRPGGCFGELYSASCCVSEGECCSDYPTSSESVGSCAGRVTCLP